MHPVEFSEDSWGRVVQKDDYWAFVPRDLPPKIDLTWELVAQVSAAERALAELSGLARNLPDPQLLIRPFVRREAVLSSRIEGTQASLSDLLLFEAARIVDAPEPPRMSDVVEVSNYVGALDHGLERMREFPISLRLIREMHFRLMKGVRGDHLTPGELRRSQNWIGPAGSLLANATFVPPPPAEMKQALEALERYLHTPSDLPAVIRLALVHYQFEAIHPFLDGNGRMGRLLITLLLCHEGLLTQPLLYLSAYFEARRADYYKKLMGVSLDGNWGEWIAFFLDGVAQQSRDAVWRAEAVLDLLAEYRRRYVSARSSALLLRLIDELFESPAITIGQTAKRLGVTQRTAALTIGKLVKGGILSESTGRQRGRVYVARGIIEALERPMPPRNVD